MNERIKQLMTQASTIRCSGFGETEILDPEKFAELIIRECAKVLEIQGANTGHEQYYYGAGLIEEHFGVSE